MIKMGEDRPFGAFPVSVYGSPSFHRRTRSRYPTENLVILSLGVNYQTGEGIVFILVEDENLHGEGTVGWGEGAGGS